MFCISLHLAVMQGRYPIGNACAFLLAVVIQDSYLLEYLEGTGGQDPPPPPENSPNYRAS